MKKILISNSSFLILLALLLLASCGKERACRCVPKDGGYAERTMVYTDNALSCKNITRLGYERQLDGSLVRTMAEVECEDATNETAE